MGKRKKKLSNKWLPFEDAKAYVQKAQRELGVNFTVTQFRAWHAVIKPKFIPITPFLVYGPEWESWNDFLGNDRVPVGAQPEKYLPYWEAVRWAQKHCREFDIKSGTAWKAWVVQNPDKLPGNVPAKPNKVYREFTPNGAWRVWTGAEIQHMIEAQQHNIALLALCNLTSEPANIVEVVIAPDGITQLTERVQKRGDLRIIKTFVYEPEHADLLHRMFQTKCRHRDGNVWYSPNVSDLLFELSSLLLIYKPDMVSG